MSSERRSKDKLAIDPELVRELARLLEETGLSEIEFERDGQRVRVARQMQALVPGPSRLASAADLPLLVPEAASIDPAKHPGVVTSPMVGTAYVGPEPGSRPFVEVGSRVQTGDSYLNIPALLAACEITGADAVHPGYGFLAENARFAEILAEHDIHFIGPKPAHIRLMGDKIEARRTAERLGMPVVPGSNGGLSSDAEEISAAHALGFPVLLKAAD